jgi:5'-3' exonuclease
VLFDTVANMSTSDRPVLIIDGLNSFIRSYAAYPTMSSHGYQMGGCIGFLKTLRRLTNDIAPSAVYIAWEGGGSQKRRTLYSEYKMNRKPEKLNRFYEDDIPDSEHNKQQQLVSLLGMLKCVPVCQLYVSDCEGDDVIAYLTRGPFRGHEKVIASSDKDMYQLLDDSTRIYSLHKKTFVTIPDVVNDFRVQPKNFAIAKALCGDPSDNIPGIKGLGFKTVARVLPFLSLEEDVMLEDIFKYCHTHSEESVVYRRILEREDEVKRNYKLVYLDGGMLSQHQSAKVDHLVNTFNPKMDRMGLIKNLVREGINDFDVEGFFYAFNCIENVENRTRN